MPVSSIVFMMISSLICFALPIGGYLFFRVKGEKYVGVFIAGCLSFYVTQIIIRLPLLQLVLIHMTWYQSLSGQDGFLYPYGYGLFLGFTAGLFETFGRFITLNYLLKKRLSYRTGIVHGLGHGGIEAMVLVGLNYFIYIAFSIGLNNGSESPLSRLIPIDQQGILIDILTGTQPYMFLLSGVERGLTILIQVAFSLMMTVGIMKGKTIRTFLMVLFSHTLLDMLVVVLGAKGVNIWFIELLVLVFAVVGVIYMVKVRAHIKDSMGVDEASKAVDEGY